MKQSIRLVAGAAVLALASASAFGMGDRESKRDKRGESAATQSTQGSEREVTRGTGTSTGAGTAASGTQSGTSGAGSAAAGSANGQSTGQRGAEERVLSGQATTADDNLGRHREGELPASGQDRK